MNCIIIEDEPLAMLRMKEYVSKVRFLKLLRTFDNSLEAVALLQSEKIDLVFLDIEMDELSGIQLLDTLKNRPEIIITTAFDQYAVKAFELQVSDYLLKPFTFERFLKAVLLVQDKLNSGESATEPHSYVFIKTEYRLQKVFFMEIFFIEGMRDYRKIHCLENKIMTLETFGELEDKLPDKEFCRVHKSFIVALNKIESVERDMVKIQNEMIPISLTYKDKFYKLIKHSSK